MKKEAEKFTDSRIMEGMTSIRAVLEGKHRNIERILFDRERETAHIKEIAYLKHRGEELGFEVVGCDRQAIDDMTVGNSHGGIIAVCSDRILPELSAGDISPDGFWVVLDGIEDPYNFGYCLRSLYAAGVDGVILPPRNWLSAAGVVCRASAGASERFDIYISEPAKAAEMMKKKGYTVVAADKTDEAISIYDTDIKRPVFLMIGGEKRGINRAALDMCDITVMLDYGREFRAALSAASAASVIAFEIFRKGRSDGKA
ncbi:MAG: RNA methyltransferase [Clostridia bacterium]|nr:RNA methyltransferase [Clostridia bacterium]